MKRKTNRRPIKPKSKKRRTKRRTKRRPIKSKSKKKKGKKIKGGGCCPHNQGVETLPERVAGPAVYRSTQATDVDTDLFRRALLREAYEFPSVPNAPQTNKSQYVINIGDTIKVIDDDLVRARINTLLNDISNAGNPNYKHPIAKKLGNYVWAGEKALSQKKTYIHQLETQLLNNVIYSHIVSRISSDMKSTVVGIIPPLTRLDVTGIETVIDIETGSERKRIQVRRSEPVPEGKTFALTNTIKDQTVWISEKSVDGKALVMKVE